MSNPTLINGVQESQLFTTSLASDVQSSKGYLKIGRMSETKKSLIADMIQVKYRAEVVQIYTVSTTFTPTGGTNYTIEFGDTNRTRNGQQETLKRVIYQTPSDVTTLGATAALQREAINVALIAKINGFTASYFVTAATSAGGTGFTITDSAGYYPVNAQTMTIRLGATFVQTCKNADQTGFAGTEASVTTPAVYSFGVGADLAAWKPVIDVMWGNLISGYLGGTAPTDTTGAYATSGQKYDGFAVVSLTPSPIATTMRNQTAFIPKVQIAYVDNGTGTSTSNLTGFIAFEREAQRHVFDLYKNDPSAIYDFFDAGLIASLTYPTTGLTVTTTDNVVMAATGSQGFEWYVNPIGTHTVLTPIVGTTGLSLILDATDEEGMEISAPNLTQCPKEFVVGKSEYSFYARVSSAAWNHLEEFAFGLRKKAAYAVNLVAYDVASADFAAMGVVSEAVDGVLKIQTSKAAAGVVAGTTCGTFTSGAIDLMITVDINGLCAFYVNGANKTSTQTAAYSFVAGTHLIPFIDTTLDANADAAPLCLQMAGLPSINWRSFN